MASQPAIVSSSPEEPMSRINSKTFICLVAVNLIYLAQLTSVIGTGFLAQSMAQAVGGTDKTVWYSSCITIMTVALNPPISQAADYWGRKPILIASSLIGVAGSIIVSRAQNSGTIIAGFAVLGLNFGCQSVILAVLSEVLPRHWRPIGQASSSIASSVGASIGLLIGGGLLQHGNLTNYRIYWYILAGFYVVATLGCFIGYNPPPRAVQASLSTSEKLYRLDWVGYLLFAPGLALFSMALAWSKNPYSWNSANILAPFIIGIVAMILFVVYEWRFKKDGILHHDLWTNRNLAISLLIMFVEGLAFFAANSYFVFEIIVLYDASILSAGTNFSIMFFTGLAFSPIFGLWSSKLKTMRPQLILGCVFLLLFFILLATVKIDTPRYAFWIFPITSGIALVSILPISMVSAQLTTSSELISLASALMITVRSLGGAIGLAINNAVLNDTLDTELPKKVGAAVLALGLPPSSLPELIRALATQSKAAVAAVPGITPEIAQAAVVAMKRAYLMAFRNAWIVSAAFCAVLVLASIFIKEQRADFDARIDAPMDVVSYDLKAKDMEMTVENNGQKETSVQHNENAALADDNN
ncbi:siderophore iron transporter, putative [Talaromyces stipitatus ATCC 10500]|uniref:Siderophore iron transporter, putative n=1 Tax=Talaromyces stipitatus (strain ATCC 10500 / CBS 375.48 / QM 6759 / NRRL 1006) TaxID=441959 RepID=B8MKF5_TALSN|nr:siderophore iron transporter, putative [Talaromyces stipitatus ATCC 10500]EED15310.1 siderophore iron transporter, putative [Talaromyces stipitatus ATCC 10500]